MTESDEALFEEFKKFVVDNQKVYSSINEYNARFEIFKSNYQKIHLLRANTNSFQKGITKFFDLTPTEFRQQYLGLKVDSASLVNHMTTVYEPLVLATPEPATFDWRAYGVVSGVKDQGQCGSCWAFSTVGNIEGLYAIKYKQLKTFSEQQLVSCDTYDNACNGGWMESAMTYIQYAGGLTTSDVWPYTSGPTVNPGYCYQLNQSQIAVQVTKSEMISTDENEIKKALYSRGPLAVVLNAGESLQYYRGGIIDMSPYECNPYGLDHAVLLVGYGTENGRDYWIVKNSWGQWWGENGYFRMARGKGTCGINAHVVTATIA